MAPQDPKRHGWSGLLAWGKKKSNHFIHRGDSTSLSATDEPQEAETAVGPESIRLSSLCTKNAPIWNSFLEGFEENHAEDCDALLAAMVEKNESCIENWNGLFKPHTAGRLNRDRPSNAVMQRIKTFLPCLGPIKAVTISVVTCLAKLDPHQIAPLVCSVVFGSLEVGIALGLLPLALR
jgi:hypothetical protein